MGLLDSVVGALANGQRQGQGGGLGDALGGLLGRGQGGGQAALISAVLAMLAQSGSSGGGLRGLIEKFQRGGLGDVVGSWVGTGQNLPISPTQVTDVFGSDVLGQVAGHLGVSPEEASSQLSQWLPQTVDQLTPNGTLPAETDAGGLGDIGAILGRFGQR